jgi:hypothetical protein
VDIDDLCQQCGPDRVYRILEELRSHGYVELVTARIKGRFAGQTYYVKELPDLAVPDAILPDLEKPDTVKPDLVEPDTEEPDPAEPRPANPAYTNNRIYRSENLTDNENSTENAFGRPSGTPENTPENPMPEGKKPFDEMQVPDIAVPELPGESDVDRPHPPTPFPIDPALRELIITRGLGLRMDDKSALQAEATKINWLGSWCAGNDVKMSPEDKEHSLTGCNPPMDAAELTRFYDDWGKRKDRYGGKVYPPTTPRSMAAQVAIWRNQQQRQDKVKSGPLYPDALWHPTNERKKYLISLADRNCSRCEGNGYVTTWDPREPWRECDCLDKQPVTAD